MTLSLIVAVAENGVIGRENALPWRIPEDLKRFKAITIGHPVVMGRRTFESIGKPLPGRRNLVISRNPDYRPAGVERFGGLDEALAAAGGEAEVFVIGGAELFKESLPRADRLYLTKIHRAFSGDTYFPLERAEALFRNVRETRHETSGEEPFSYSFIEAERCR